jgi:hypothetical protein
MKSLAFITILSLSIQKSATFQCFPHYALCKPVTKGIHDNLKLGQHKLTKIDHEFSPVYLHSPAPPRSAYMVLGTPCLLCTFRSSFSSSKSRQYTGFPKISVSMSQAQLKSPQLSEIAQKSCGRAARSLFELVVATCVIVLEVLDLSLRLGRVFLRSLSLFATFLRRTASWVFRRLELPGNSLRISCLRRFQGTSLTVHSAGHSILLISDLELSS